MQGVRFLDGDKTNCSLDNLGLFTRAESLQMTRLGFSDVPKDLKPTVTAMAQLDTKVFEVKHKNSGRLSKAEVEAKIMELGAGKGAFQRSPCLDIRPHNLKTHWMGFYKPL